MKSLATIAMAEARTRYCKRLPGVEPAVEHVKLEQAAGRVLAASVQAPVDVPAFSKATVDGYAVRAADTVGAADATPVRLPVAGRVAMGRPAGEDVRSLPAGCALRIATGGAVPAGADAVIMQEYTDGGMEQVAIRSPVRPGEGILPRASDVRAGEELATSGSRLSPAAVGVLAGIGCTRVPVYARPSVAIITTGREIVPPGVEPGPGEVRDMNGPALTAYVRADGGEPAQLGILGDDYDELLGVLREAVAQHAVVLLSGGASVGERDWVPAAVEALGRPGVVVHGIALKPGKPTVLGLIDETPVLGLPGNPVSALVVYLLFGRPVVRHVAGEAGAFRPRPPAVVRARLAAAVHSPAAREEYLRVRLEPAAEGWLASALPAASGLLTSMVRGDGLLRIPVGTERLQAGQLVEVTPLT